ncbi:MAG: c-type cytochrome [Ferruginibacter sp.]
MGKPKIAFLLSIGFILIVFSCAQKQDYNNLNTTTNVSGEELVQRGEYLVSVIGCDDCHSPKVMGKFGPEVDPDLRLSGYPANRPLPKVDSMQVKNGWALFNGDLTATVGPWGVSYAANITSDATGIGSWTEEQFSKALTQGKWKGMENSRPLLPPMPWQNFSKLKHEDVRAIFAYLKTTKPVSNVEPQVQPLHALK